MFPQVVQVICTAGALSAWKLWSRSPKVVSIRSTLRRFVFGPLHVENLKVLRLCGTAWRATLPSATDADHRSPHTEHLGCPSPPHRCSQSVTGCCSSWEVGKPPSSGTFASSVRSPLQVILHGTRSAIPG